MKNQGGQNELTAIGADIARHGGMGINLANELIQIDERELGCDPMELWKMQVDETGWVVGLPAHPQMWGVLDRLTPGQDVMVSLDPNFPGFVDVFEPLGSTRAGQLPRLGTGVLLGWNDECQDDVRPLGEIPESEWQPVESCPPMAEVYGRDAAGRVAVFLREESGGFYPVAGGLPGRKVGAVVEWCYLGASEVDTVQVIHRTAPSAQNSPSDASDGLQMGLGRGEAPQSDCTPARTSAASDANGNAEI